MSEQFVNPYTFIPVNDGKKREYQSYLKAPLLSGKISCRLRTKTQISVCDSGTKERDYKFFSIDERPVIPVIPGSSIRGVVRGIYEALTDSCFSSVNAEDKDYFSSRMKKRDPGLLTRENGEYVLYKAIRHKDKQRDNPLIPEGGKTGDRVTFKKKETLETESGEKTEILIDCEGYVHRVDFFKNKGRHNFESVFERGERVGEIDDEILDRFRVNIENYTPKKKGCKDEYKAAFDRMCEGDGFLPCWYIKENGHYYFAPSQMSRSIYFNKPIDLLAKQNLQKCSSKSEICEACALFGMVSGENAASRVRFGDAECVSTDPLDGTFLLPILAEPRLSSFEFYLTNPYSGYGADDERTRISGRKFYWHNNKANITQNAENKAGNNMDASVQLVKKGKDFCFDVFFDGITELTLKRLLFALTLGENDLDGTKCHKLGHGKPIGLGSVKIIAERVVVRRFEKGEYTETDVSALVSENLREAFEEQRNVDNVLLATDFNAVSDGSLISYPHTDGSTDIFEWFKENRAAFKNGKQVFKQKLPRLGADPWLETKTAEDNNGGSQGGRSGGYHGGRYR